MVGKAICWLLWKLTGWDGFVCLIEGCDMKVVHHGDEYDTMLCSRCCMKCVRKNKKGPMV